MNNSKNKTTWHSHIKGFNSKYTDFLNLSRFGLVCQKNFIISIQIIVDLIKKNKTSGQVILITGKSGSGKTALGLALAKELGTKIPFCLVNGAELSSLLLKRPNKIIQKLRKSVGIRIMENIEFYEGEVSDIKYNLKNGEEISNYSYLIVELKTSEGSLRIKIQNSLCKHFIQNKIQVGDIIYIEPEKCLIKKLGKSFFFYQEDEISNFDYVSIPVGKVFKKKKLIRDITLSDLDMVNIGYFNKNSFKIEDISDYLRQEIDKLVSIYIESKKASILYGVLFIDEAHNLGINSFYFLSKFLDSKFSPLVILSTNRTNLINLNGYSCSNLPFCFLDRCISLRTKSYSYLETAQIITIKAKDQGLILSGKSLINLSKISIITSLRFSILLSLVSGNLCRFFHKSNISYYFILFVNYIFLFYRESQKLCGLEKMNLKIRRIL